MGHKSTAGRCRWGIVLVQKWLSTIDTWQTGGSSDIYYCLWSDKPGLSMTRVDEAAEVFKRWECWVNPSVRSQFAHHFGFPFLGETQSGRVRDQMFQWRNMMLYLSRVTFTQVLQSLSWTGEGERNRSGFSHIWPWGEIDDLLQLINPLKLVEK